MGVRKGGPYLWLIIILTLVLASGCTSALGRATPQQAASPAPGPTPAHIQPDDSWIEISLVRQLLILHEGPAVVGEFPASTGVLEAPTPPGLYRVQMKEKGPIENVPGVWVADILIFDWGKGNGIHSMPMDSEGHVLDPTLGAVSTGGCVRVGESAAVFEFARLGMRVWIH